VKDIIRIVTLFDPLKEGTKFLVAIIKLGPEAGFVFAAGTSADTAIVALLERRVS
jgi:hypothetical protein